MTARRMCALLMVLVLLSSFGCGSGQPSVTVSEPDPWEMTTAQVVRDMGIGIDLGNTYEAFGDWVDQWGDGSVESYVTCWGSPVITREIIQGYADEGFGVLRIPVHWFNLMGDDYTISPENVLILPAEGSGVTISVPAATGDGAGITTIIVTGTV